MIFLDTDVMIDLLRGFPPAVAWFESLGDEEIVLSGFVGMELHEGCEDKTEQARVDKALTGITMVWPSEVARSQASSVHARLHLSHNLGILDAVIGQTSIELDLPLYTFNHKLH